MADFTGKIHASALHNTNGWGIPSMETYLTSIMIRKKGH
jgi:hypothetical protein